MTPTLQRMIREAMTRLNEWIEVTTARLVSHGVSLEEIEIHEYPGLGETRIAVNNVEQFSYTTRFLSCQRYGMKTT